MPSSEDQLSRLKVALRQYVLSRLQAEAIQREVEAKSQQAEAKSQEALARYASLVTELEAATEVLREMTPTQLEQLCSELRHELERVRADKRESWSTSSLDQVLASTFQSIIPASLMVIVDRAAAQAEPTDWAAYFASLDESAEQRPPRHPDPNTCSQCDSRAVFHITDFGSGEPAEVHLCEEHAREYLTDDRGM
jgi:dsDNA-specific endonuclease/ATPase MutS2